MTAADACRLLLAHLAGGELSEGDRGHMVHIVVLRAVLDDLGIGAVMPEAEVPLSRAPSPRRGRRRPPTARSAAQG